jgi:predicted nucleic acid-binding Zn ribbon protein
MFQSMKDEPIKICVRCGGNVKKLIGAGAGIIFKGSGFYVNDYKSGSARNETACKNRARINQVSKTVRAPRDHVLNSKIH